MRREDGLEPRAADDVAPAARRAWLAAILAVGLGARAFRLTWGLPGYVVPDAFINFIRPAAGIVGGGQLVPPLFAHPPVLVYVLAAVYAAWSLVTGTPVPTGRAALFAQLPALALLARGLGVALATASVAMLYLVARRLVGARAALLGAAALALAPLHVLESHRIQPDGPMILVGLWSAHAALVARDRRAPRRLLAAFALAGLAGATKYTGLASVTVPLWIACTWRDAPVAVRLRLAAAGAGVALLGFAAGMSPAAFNWQSFVAALRTLSYYSHAATQPGLDLSGEGWVYVRYVYAFVVALPYMMGWPVYLAGLAGFAIVARTNRAALGVLGAAVLPFFVVQGESPLVVARYYQPLAPYLALGAGVTLDRLRTAGARVGVVATLLVLGYTAALTGSQCLRLGLGPQRAVAALVAAVGRDAVRDGRTAAVAYPDPLTLFYDALRPSIAGVPGITVVPVPQRYQDLRADPAGATTERELIAGDLRWIAETGVEMVILPSWIENAFVRERPEGHVARFYRRLADGRLGFRLAAHLETRYLTQGLYVWGDPMLDTHWETGLTGYKVFLRSPP
jgi:hypothetical protein